MYWLTSFVLVCLIVTEARCANADDDKSVYVTQKLKDIISCITNPINDICPLDKKVLNGTDYTMINQTINTILTQLRSHGENDTCTAAAKKYECAKSISVCDDDYVYVDSMKAYKWCMIVRQNCSGLNETLKDKYFACTKPKDNSKRMRNIMCKAYPSMESGGCPKQGYKVPSYANSTSGSLLYNNAKDLTKKHNVGEKCTKAVLGAICKFNYQACTKNEEYAVSLLSKEKCKKTMECLTAANATLEDKTMSLCNRLPSEKTAKKLPICDVDLPTCAGSRLYAMSHILVVFTVWFFLGSFAN